MKRTPVEAAAAADLEAGALAVLPSRAAAPPVEHRNRTSAGFESRNRGPVARPRRDRGTGPSRREGVRRGVRAVSFGAAAQAGGPGLGSGSGNGTGAGSGGGATGGGRRRVGAAFLAAVARLGDGPGAHLDVVDPDPFVAADGVPSRSRGAPSAWLAAAAGSTVRTSVDLVASPGPVVASAT